MLAIPIELAVLLGVTAIVALLYLNWRVGPSVRISIRENATWKRWFERDETTRRARTSPDRRVVTALWVYVWARNLFLLACVVVVVVLLLQSRG